MKYQPLVAALSALLATISATFGQGTTAFTYQGRLHSSGAPANGLYVDADGVALAAIQGLNEKVEVGSQRSEDRSRKLEEKLEQKETEIRELKQRLEALEQIIHHQKTK